MDIKQTLNAELNSQPRRQEQFQCKFKRSSVCFNQQNASFIGDAGDVSGIFKRRQSSNGDNSMERMKANLNSEKLSSVTFAL
jgi:hypothetical protein